MGAENPHKQASERLPEENRVHASPGNNSAVRVIPDTHNFGKITGEVEHLGLEASMVGISPGRNDRPMIDTRLKTPAEAADYMRCSMRTLWEWKASGRLAYYRMGRWVRFSVSDLDDVIARCRVPARREIPRKRRMMRADQEGRKA